LAGENFTSFVSLFDGSLQHQTLLLHPAHVALEDHDLAVALAQLLSLELHLELQFLELLDDFLLRVGSASILRVQLPLLVLYLRSQLLDQLVELQDQPLLLPLVFLQALSLALIQFLEPLRFTPRLVSLVLSLVQFVFEVFNSAAHVSLPGLHLAFVDLSLLGDFLLLRGLRLLDLPHELLFFEGELLALKFDHLELLLVLPRQLRELEFALPELRRLVLELLVYGHQLFKFALLASEVCHQASVLAH